MINLAFSFDIRLHYISEKIVLMILLTIFSLALINYELALLLLLLLFFNSFSIFGFDVVCLAFLLAFLIVWWRRQFLIRRRRKERVDCRNVVMWQKEGEANVGMGSSSISLT